MGTARTYDSAVPESLDTQRLPLEPTGAGSSSSQNVAAESSLHDTAGCGIEHAPPPPAFDSPLAREIALAQLEAAVLGKSPTLLRRESEPTLTSDVRDPVLEASVRSRVAAIAALAGVVYAVAFPLDLGMHAAFRTAELTSPARLKNLVMAILAWWVYRAARKASFSIDTVARLALLLVFAVGLHQTLESLHFFQFPGHLSLEGGTPGTEASSMVDGLTWTCVFMVLFPPFVPGSPRKHLCLALALALPLLLLPLAWSAVSGIDYFRILSPETFACVPLSVILSVFASRAIHRIEEALRTERRRSRELGSYVLVQELGRGGMGQVWLARHRMLARPAALKIIKADRLDVAPERAASALRRFEREARATARLRSMHTVEIYDFGQTDAGDFYYVMELLDGMDLEALVARDGPQAAWRVVRILRQVCLSLSEAHRQGLIHRDVKPANIFLCRQGTELDVIKVLDFGLVTEVVRADRDDREDRGDASTLIRDNEIVGTPAFMAPEMVVAPDEVDHRADLYALGCVAYFLLTGRHVFEEKTVVGLLSSHVHKALPSPLFDATRMTVVPKALEGLVTTMLAKRPDDRPQSADAVLSVLEHIDVGGVWDDEEMQRWWRDVAPPAVLASALAHAPAHVPA
ncbi:MAG: serine/threonine protein kinase [Deltaproteobacteria bacterium]|nr:serine/threonine protein kinase [Deltaproteobacteria bacterium]